MAIHVPGRDCSGYRVQAKEHVGPVQLNQDLVVCVC